MLRSFALACALGALSVSAWGKARPVVVPKVELSEAERLYRQGLLPSGQPLQAERAGAGTIEGAAAACVNCHRRSGFGTEEGRIFIPPVVGKYLFRDSSPEVMQMAHPGGEAATPRRSRYSSTTLARAIREGLDPDGRALDYLMPRYQLDDATMSLLIAYLKQLSARPAPGALPDSLEFATIVTPDVDPAKRDAVLDVVSHFFGNKNAFYRGADPPLQSNRKIHYRVLRRWNLHVWELSGAPDTWEAQLREHFKATPVFAVISGVGGRDWEPVHRFCESESVPCLLPSVDLPVVAEKDFYPVYFSRGVLLESDVIASRLGKLPESARPKRLIQVYRGDDIGAAAAQRLSSDAAALGIAVTMREVSGQPAQALKAAVREANEGDALALWLRPEDLKALPAQPGAAKSAFVSGLMAGLDDAPIPEGWHAAVRITYPYDLPAQRRTRMDYPLGWFRIQHIKVVDERAQTEAYLACSIIAEAAGTMLDNFVPDYLIERVEVELSHRIINGYFPRLGLAPGQRFASKGAFLARYAEPTGNRLVADGEWIVP